MDGLVTGVDGVELRGKSEQEYAAVLQAAGSRAVFEVCLPRVYSVFKVQVSRPSTLQVWGADPLRLKVLKGSGPQLYTFQALRV